MLKFALAVAALLGMTAVGFAQSTAGDQGAPGTSVNRNQRGTASPGTGTQGTATNNQSGRSGAERAGVDGQIPQGSGRVPANQTVARSTGGNLESHAADCLTLKNEEEIALLQFASQKIQNDDLKQSVQKMIQDHQQAISKLQRFAGHGGHHAQPNANTSQAAPPANTTGASGTAVTSRDAGRPQTREALRVGTEEKQPAGAVAYGDAHDAMYQVAMREKEECLKLTESDLNKHTGAKFDMALADQQCVMHTSMLAHLKALQQSQVSSEFGQLLAELEKTTQHHKETLGGMMDKLAQDADSNRARK
jgi:predicted outer membrane protein